MDSGVRRFERVFLLAFFFLAALVLRLRFLSLGPFHYDALDLALCAQKTLETGLLHYEHGTGFPLTVLIGAFFVFVGRVFGVTDPVLCVNAMSAFMGALAVPLLYFVVERMFDRHRAALAAMLLIFFPPHVAISTFGKSLTLSICFVLASVYFVLRYIQDESRPLKDLFLSAIFLGLCGASRLSDLILALPVFSLALMHERRGREALVRWTVWAAVVLATAVIYYLPLLMGEGLAPFLLVLSDKTQAKFLGLFSKLLIISFRWVYDHFQLSGLLVVLLGFGWMVAGRRIRTLVFLLIWFLAVQLFYGNVSSGGVRYLVVGWIALLVAQSYFLGLYQKKGRVLGLTVFFLLAFLGFLPHIETLEARHRHSLQADYAQWVASLTASEDLILAMDDGIFVEHYGGRRTLGHPSGIRDAALLGDFFAEINGALKAGHRVFALQSNFDYDRWELFKEEFFRRYDVKIIGCKPNEDWHHFLLNRHVADECFMEVQRR